MPQLTDTELLNIVNDEFDRSLGIDSGEISTERAKAWNYYLSKPLGNEIEGLSQVVSSDVAEVVDSIMPSLLRLFTTAENLVSFDAVGPEDEDQSKQESDYVNYLFFKRNPSFLIMFYWFFDALVQKNGIVKAWQDESTVVTTETYKSLSELELFDLMDDEELDAVERAERIEQIPGPDGALVPTTVHDIEFKRTVTTGRVRVDNVPPEEYRISADSRSLDPSEARMVGQERNIKRSDLLDMGFDQGLVETLGTDNDDLDSPEAIARRDKSEEGFDAASDRSQDDIQVREAYIMVDFEDTGHAELRQVFTSGNSVLSNEPSDRQPFHVICPHPLPHKHFGQSSADKVMDIQDVSTTLERQILENLYHSNNPGHAINENMMGEDTMDDLLSTRVGKVTRFDGPVGDAWSPIVVPFTAGASFNMLEYFDQRKKDRTGISSDSEGLSPDSLKNIQQSVMAQANDIGRMKIEAIARIFAETGMKSLFRHIHELVLKHKNKKEVISLRGEWIDVDPAQWRSRTDMTVNIGLGIGSKETNLMHLQSISALQEKIIAGGGQNLLVTPDNVWNLASEVVKNANLKNPSLYFTNPQGQLAPPQSDEQTKLIEQQQQLDANQQTLDAAKQQLAEDRQDFTEQAESAKIKLQEEKQDSDVMLELEAQNNELTIENEKIKTRLLEIELEHGSDDRPE